MQTDKKRFLNADDMDRLEYVSMPELTPDGELAAYVVKRWDVNTGTLIRRVNLAAMNGSFCLELDTDTKVDKTTSSTPDTKAAASTWDPRFSPDGTKLAFLCDAGNFPQSYVAKLASLSIENELDLWISCERVTDLRHGVSSFTWNPEGTAFAFTAPLWENEVPFPEMSAQEKEDFQWELEHMPRTFNELMYKFDSCYGLVDGSVSQIGVVNAEGSNARMLTNGNIPYSCPVWSPDGSSLYFYGRPYPHARAMCTELFTCRVSDLSNVCPPVHQITHDFPFSASAPITFLPDGEHIIYISNYTSDNQPDSGEEYSLRLFSMDLNGGNRICLQPECPNCDGIDPLHVGITESGTARSPYYLSTCGKYIYFASGWNGRAGIYRLSLDDSHEIIPAAISDFSKKDFEKSEYTAEDFSIIAFAAPVGNQMPVILTTETMPAEFCLWDMENKTWSRPYPHNQWLDEVALSSADILWMKTDNPEMPVQGFFLPVPKLPDGTRPEHSGEGRSFHYIHGGPEAFYAVGFDFEAQLLAASGVPVMYCNPRGSAGYGSAFVASSLSYNGTAYRDLMDFTDLVLSRYPELKADRITIGGGSHGGWMTNYIVGHTNRFYGAVNQRTWSNPATSYGTGDMGFYTLSTLGASDFQEYMRNRVKSGTITTIDNATTPMLILHGEKDYRCTLEQGEQVYSAMKDRNPDIPCRLVVFPGENHGVTRTGKLHAQKRHLTEMRNWCLKNWDIQKEKEDLR